MDRKTFERQPTPVDPRTVALIAVMTAIVLVLTSLIKVPTPAKGYAHLGDSGVFFSAFALGPWVAAAAGGLGTALADIVGGYPQWAVFSLLIHGFQGWIVGWLARRWSSTVGLIVAIVVGGVVVVGGYLLAGIWLSGQGAALGEVPLNVIQVAVGAIVGLPLFVAVRRAYPPISRFAYQPNPSAALMVSLLMCLLGILAAGIVLSRLLYWHSYLPAFDLPLAVVAGPFLLGGLFGILLQTRRRRA